MRRLLITCAILLSACSPVGESDVSDEQESSSEPVVQQEPIVNINVQTQEVVVQ